MIDKGTTMYIGKKFVRSCPNCISNVVLTQLSLHKPASGCCEMCGTPVIFGKNGLVIKYNPDLEVVENAEVCSQCGSLSMQVTGRCMFCPICGNSPCGE